MSRAAGRGVPPQTLPDLLRDGLDVVFVGINPGLYSAAQGHYFARRTNRFWPAFSRSTLSREARRGLGLAMLEPAHDAALLAYGFGFTDVAKRASARASELPLSELAAGVADLVGKLEHHRPRIACFHGITGYRQVMSALDPTAAPPALGIQTLRIGETHCFLVPSPSGANAHFTPADQTGWYDRLAEFAHSLAAP